MAPNVVPTFVDFPGSHPVGYFQGSRVAHSKRLRDGELYAVTPRLSWALLVRRTFDVTRLVNPEGEDVMVCVRCVWRLKVRAVVTAVASTAKNLASKARSRAPPQAA